MFISRVSIVVSFILGLILLGNVVGSSFAEENYNPHINPSDFTTEITNKYFSLPVGKKMIYEAQTNDGLEKIEIQIFNKTKTIMGVTTLLYGDKVWLNGQLHEDTKDWLAQDNNGNVWYFGEEVNNYEGGKLKDHAGSWIAGENGALPGIWIKANQKLGDSYRQEYYKGKAEDMRDVISINETVKTKRVTYTGCVKVYDWTPLDPKSKEHKYYCPEVGALVLNEHLVQGKRTELVNVIQSQVSPDGKDNDDTSTADDDNDKNWPFIISVGIIITLLVGIVISKQKNISKLLGKESSKK